MLKVVLIVAAGTCVGGLLGLSGSCETGSCPLTASPWRGAFFGGLFSLAFLLLGQGCKPSQDNSTQAPQQSTLKSVTVETFDDAVKGKLVLVDFWATWCGPCQQQLPILEQVADKVRPQADVVKVDIDQNSDLANRFSVRSVPTLVVLQDGKEVQRFVGVQSEEKLVAALSAK